MFPFGTYYSVPVCDSLKKSDSGIFWCFEKIICFNLVICGSFVSFDIKTALHYPGDERCVSGEPVSVIFPVFGSFGFDAEVSEVVAGGFADLFAPGVGFG